MTLFKGLGETYRLSSSPVLAGVVNPQITTFAAQVLEVCLDKTSKLYRDETDIGAVRFKPLRFVRDAANIYEDEVNNVAHPLDRSVARYPIAGEQVLIVVSAGDSQRDSADHDQLITSFFYTFVISSQKNTTYNSHPFIGTDETEITRGQVIPLEQASRRFDTRVNDLSAFKDSNNKIKIYKQLRPYEGDFILQGRFGNTIRFGSTSAASNTPWSRPGASVSGVSGDPITILRVDRQVTQDPSKMLVEESIDTDDASVYLCSSQRVELSLSCTSKLKAWSNTFGITSKSDSAASRLLNKSTSDGQVITQTT